MKATRLVRVAVTVLALTFVVGVGAASAASPSPAPNTLGAQVSSTVIGDEGGVLYVTNLGSVPTTFTADAPEGWSVTPASLPLEPGDKGEFTLTGQGESGKVVVLGTMTHPGSGAGDTSAIRFGSIQVMATRPYDLGRELSRGLPVNGVPVLWLLIALIFLVLFLIRVRPWRLRLRRV